MSSLRQEIIEAQKVRSEILKWKLILVAALGAVGLGFSNPNTVVPNAYLVLLLIPLVCFYVDLLCKHMSLRIIVIGDFLRFGSKAEEEDAAYESFVFEARTMGPRKNMNTFAFEEWALDGSTIVLSLLVMLVGLASSRLAIPISANDRYLFIGSGLAGLVLTFTAHSLYKRRVKTLEGLVVKHSLAPKPPPSRPPPPPPAA